ncbi:MAG: phosphoribosyltransferase family protein [Pseudomonadota bacterium]
MARMQFSVEHLAYFANRQDAGRQLAERLAHRHEPDPLVLALPRGGVPVGYEIAARLAAPLDVLLVRKLGAPGFPELGLGAVVDGPNPQRILNERVVEAVQPPPGWIEAEEARQLEVIARRKRLLRRGRAPEPLRGRTVILVDDGIATGGTVRVALRALSQAGVRHVVLAVPVAPPTVLATLPVEPEDLVCLLMPSGFQSVGQYYADFEQVSDEEVVELLERSQQALQIAQQDLQDRRAMR